MGDEIWRVKCTALHSGSPCAVALHQWLNTGSLAYQASSLGEVAVINRTHSVGLTLKNQGPRPWWLHIIPSEPRDLVASRPKWLGTANVAGHRGLTFLEKGADAVTAPLFSRTIGWSKNAPTLLRRTFAPPTARHKLDAEGRKPFWANY